LTNGQNKQQLIVYNVTTICQSVSLDGLKISCTLTQSTQWSPTVQAIVVSKCIHISFKPSKAVDADFAWLASDPTLSWFLKTIEVPSLTNVHFGPIPKFWMPGVGHELDGQDLA